MIDLVGILNSAIDLIDHAVRVVLGILGPELSVAILAGFVVSGGSTQYLKAFPKLINSPKRVLWTITWSIAAGFVPTFMLYQSGDLNRRFWYAAAVGLLSPWVYRLTVMLIGKYSPAARANLSGNPQHSIARNEYVQTPHE